MTNFLGLDIGTSTIKAVLLDTSLGKLISSARVATPINILPDEGAEHEPDALLSAVYACIQAVADQYPVDGLAISSFAEAGLPLDGNGEPLYPIIAWYDNRTEAQVEHFLEKIPLSELISITGQNPGFSFGLFKWLWIHEHQPDVARNTRTWLSVPDYLLYSLTGEMATDYTQASRTMLFDQQSLDWSERILSLASLEKQMLPKTYCSGTVVGQVSPAAAQKTGLRPGTPCCVGGHDHLCGAYASGGYDPRWLIDSSGSSQAVIALHEGYQPEGKWFDDGYVHYHHVLPEQYLIKGGLKAAGRAFQWLREILHLDPLPSVKNLIKKGKASNDGLLLTLPFFLGSGTPGRMPQQRAIMSGLSLEQTPEEILFSFYEGLGFWLRDNLLALSLTTHQAYEGIIAIGGTNQNPDLQLIKATLSGLPLILPAVPEASATGAALLAAVGCGAYASHREAQEALDYPSTRMDPEIDLIDFYRERFTQKYLPTKAAMLSMNPVTTLQTNQAKE